MPLDSDGELQLLAFFEYKAVGFELQRKIPGRAANSQHVEKTLPSMAETVADLDTVGLVYGWSEPGRAVKTSLRIVFLAYRFRGVIQYVDDRVQQGAEAPASTETSTIFPPGEVKT